MKMPKEYVLVLIIGLFLLAYLLEAVVDPLSIHLATPYQFLSSEYVAKVPFSTALIFIRALAIFITPLWLASFIDRAWQFKSVSLLVISVLLQLYGVQATVNPTEGVPLEWSIALTLGGAAILLPTVLYFVKGAIGTKPPAPSKNIGSLADDDDDDL